MFLVESFNNLDSSKVIWGDFCLITKSDIKASVEIQMLTGFKLLLDSANFKTFGNDNNRLILSRI